MSVSSLFPLYSESTCVLCGVAPRELNNFLSIQDWERCESALRVAVWVLETPKPELIRHLKDFLVALPAPLCIEKVLLQAICQLAMEKPDACREVLGFVEVFQPELELKQVIRQAVIKFLQANDFVLNQDFQIDRAECLQSFNSSIISVLMKLPMGDRLLVNALFPLSPA